MRAWLPVALTVPLVLEGCPAVLNDWTISRTSSVDASTDAGFEDGAGRSTFGSDGSLGRADSSWTAAGGAAGTSGVPDAGGVSSTGGIENLGGAIGTGGMKSPGGTSGTDGSAGSGPACESLQGPTQLGLTNAGAIGITFHSKVNARLVKFVFHNGGYADTVSLQDGVACSVIASVPIPAHVQSYTAKVSWPLAANKSYRLVSSIVNVGTGYNQTQAVVSSGGWPWTDGANLVVDDCAGGVDHCSSAASSLDCGWSHQYWFNFTDLEICE